MSPFPPDSFRRTRLIQAGRRVAELIRQTLPLGVECDFRLEEPWGLSEFQATLEIDEPRHDSHDIRDHRRALTAIDEFAHLAESQHLIVKRQLLGGVNNLSTVEASQMFALSLDYLRQHGVSDLTLAPLERQIADALATPAEGRPVTVPPRERG